jgi:hypothetical protein
MIETQANLLAARGDGPLDDDARTGDQRAGT